MTTSAESWQSLFEGLAKVREGWPVKEWGWDGRLRCVSSSISAEAEPAARGAIAAALPTEWTSATLAGAPENVRALADRCGGLRPGQALLSTPSTGGPAAYGLWWPWGDGTAISLRIGLTDFDPVDKPYPRLRETFGVTR
jgi:hypothetical protein